MLKQRIIIIYAALLFISLIGCASESKLLQRVEREIKIEDPNVKKVYMPFELINNLVVIPLRINDSDTMHFVLDTGVGRTLITELSDNEEFTIRYSGKVKLSGLGEDAPMEALFSSGNKVYLEGIIGDSLDVVLMMEDRFNLSSFMGRKVNGLIGYDIFKNFIVEIDYQDKRLYFHDPDLFRKEYQKKRKSRFWTEIPIEIDARKPYINSTIVQHDSSVIETKLLIDSGASHAISIYPASNPEISIPPKNLYSYLGSGLSGEIYGEIGRIKSMSFGDLTLKEPVVYYPEEEGTRRALLQSNRNGSIGADLLKRYTIFFNYEDGSMLVKANKESNKDFNYNMAGIELSTPFLGIPFYLISKIREGSPAEKAGLRENDILMEIDYKHTFKYSLVELYDLFQSRENKKISIVVRRDDEVKEFKFRLVDETRN